MYCTGIRSRNQDKYFCTITYSDCPNLDGNAKDWHYAQKHEQIIYKLYIPCQEVIQHRIELFWPFSRYSVTGVLNHNQFCIRHFSCVCLFFF